MNSKYLLILAVALIGIGLLKPNFPNFIPNRPSIVDIDLSIGEPNDDLKQSVKPVIDALKVDGDRKVDGKRLAHLMFDIGNLIALDGENGVIKNTEEIRQANKLVGALLQLNITGKYPDLKEAAQNFVVSQIGDDIVLLDPSLRDKASETFMVLAWACNEGSK